MCTSSTTTWLFFLTLSPRTLQTPTLGHYTGFELYDLQACLHDLHRTFSHAPKHPQQAVREKYRNQRQGFVVLVLLFYCNCIMNK